MTSNLDSTTKENIKLRKENTDLHCRLRVANSRIAQLEFDFDSLSRDAGEEIHKWMMKAKVERERCAKIAAGTECEAAPPEYRVASPGLEGLVSDWERQQCWHGDRIAEKIREEK